MDVVPISPLCAGSVLWRPRPDRWTLTVVCKATYALEPGESGLASEQEPVRERDAHWDEDPRRSVYAPSDLAPFKPRADVVLVGHAYAPRSELVRSLVARLYVGEIEKAIEVQCPRVLGRDGELREGQRWSKMPLRYEYAAGGLDTWNPVGIGPGAPVDAYGQRPLPHLQPPDIRVSQWRDVFVPTGFGPISASWRLRRDKLGRRAEAWSDDGWTQVALDDDFDGEFFQVAPADQQIEALHDDERLVLEYLSPDHPSLTTRLAGVRPHAVVELPGSGPRDLVMTADTLWIDTDRSRATLTWRGQVAVDGPEQKGRVLVGVDDPENKKPLTLAFGRPAPEPEPESKEEAAEPVQTPRTMGPRRTLQMPAGVVRPPEVPEATQTPRAPTPRHALQMIPDAQAGMPAWLAQPKVSPGDEVDVPRAPVAPVETTQVSIRIATPRPAEVEPALDLVWWSRALAARVREVAPWAPLLGAEASARADVSRVLSGGTPTEDDLERIVFASVDAGGMLSRPLVLVIGDLELLDASSDGVALAQRAFPERELFGRRWLRALFTPSSPDVAREAVPAYLPARARTRVPLFRRFRARLVAEVVPQEDERETSPIALCVWALAREILPRPGAR